MFWTSDKPAKLTLYINALDNTFNVFLIGRIYIPVLNEKLSE
jgi:hypothetical protein